MQKNYFQILLDVYSISENYLLDKISLTWMLNITNIFDMFIIKFTDITNSFTFFQVHKLMAKHKGLPVYVGVIKVNLQSD